ncbi:unnamed protein product [Cuscuta europaea]|uniref:F-box domain-containing protein n=1 Tax=Cuscuta europaea TaxID=41803 RepID=A0A9P0ZTZ5_CUSEU|nr:unnamed protein product [Cuscuta europaea]
MDEQIVMGVLLCLPPKAIYRFRVVSKSWNELISHQFFIERYDGRRRQRGGPRLLALFQRTESCSNPSRPNNRTNILSVDLPRNRKIKRRSLKLQDCEFINSSNGLILCRRSNNRYPKEYYVLNLITQKFVLLPPPPAKLQPCFTGIGLMCEENKQELSAKYIVVRTYSDRCENLGIETYSSETGVWAAKPSITRTAGFMRFLMLGNPLVMNGVFHWDLLGHKTLALYRPRENNLQFIRLPLSLYGLLGLVHDSHGSHAFTRSSIEDGEMLWFSTMDSGAAMTVFMLPKCVEDGASKNLRPTIILCNEWVLVYRISVDSLWNDVVLLSPKARKGIVKDQWGSVRQRNIFLDAFVPAKKEGKSSLALILRVERGGLYLYDLDHKSMECIRYCGGLVTKNEDGNVCNSLTLCPYLEPSSLSAYALD